MKLKIRDLSNFSKTKHILDELDKCAACFVQIWVAHVYSFMVSSWHQYTCYPVLYVCFLIHISKEFKNVPDLWDDRAFMRICSAQYICKTHHWTNRISYTEWISKEILMQVNKLNLWCLQCLEPASEIWCGLQSLSVSGPWQSGISKGHRAIHMYIPSLFSRNSLHKVDDVGIFVQILVGIHLKWLPVES